MGKNKIKNQKPTTDTTESNTYKRWRDTARERDFLPMVFLIVYTHNFFYSLSRSLALSQPFIRMARALLPKLLRSLCRTDTLCQCLVIRFIRFSSIGYYSRARLLVRSWLSWTRFRSLIFGSSVFVALHVCVYVHMYLQRQRMLKLACVCMSAYRCVMFVCEYVCELDTRG